MSSVAHPFRSAFVLACVANAGLLLASDPVLQNQPSLFAAPLTTATAKQDVLMNLANRASTLEGGSSGPPTPCGYLPAPIVEKPNCDPIYWLSGAVDLRTGGASYATTDLALPTAGVPVCVGRTFNSAQGSSSKYHESDSFQGWNWFQTALPEIHVVGTTIYLVGSNIGFLEYQQVSSSSVFRGVNGAPGVFEVTAAVGTTDYELYTLWEPTGRKMQFFGASSGAPNWQLWKITNPDGKRLYAGDPTSSYTAGGSGAYTGGKVAWLIQEQGASADERKYTFSYATYGGKTRLDKVQVLPKSGGSFSATPVAEVDYDYYTALTTISANGPGTNDDDGLGDAGDLKSVTVTLPLEASTNEVRTSYYRYYTNPATDFSESQDETRGYPHGLKLVLEPEGQRRAAIAAAALSTTVDATTTANLKSYSAAFYFYASPGSDPRRVKQAFVNGECGCGSSVNGLTEFTWESNTGGSWTSGYDSDWLSRIMIEQPDGTHQMRYFDEASQPLATVVTPTLPTGTSITDMWATKVERDANGRIAAIYSPAAVSSYNHTTGALTTGNVGLVTTYTRNSTSGSPFLGLLERVEFHDNSGGGATKLSEYSYTART
ncbi:MAG TPA: hypothetical protein VFF65_12385, partial [Phycisphaerales bacterium]|nr:hypothetical protein [Phycisphaerales bacterium]